MNYLCVLITLEPHVELGPLLLYHVCNAHIHDNGDLHEDDLGGHGGLASFRT